MILLRSATILSPGCKHHNKQRDILIEKGKITKIATRIKADGAREIKSTNLHVSPGWLDIGPQFCDPGYEFREDLQSGLDAAAIGGYTAVAPFPNTDPVIHSKSQVEYLLNHSKNHPVSVYPIGAITRDAQGVDIAEMFDMKQAGAVAFSDGNKPVQLSGVVERALFYVLPFGGLIILRPEDKSLSGNGQMHEGEVSTSLGMRGLPNLSEEVAISRDLRLLEYTGSRLLEFGVSTAEGLKLIKEARKSGLQVYCSAHAYQFFFSDKNLLEYDTNLKLNPPVRGDEDKKALVKAFNDGLIDILTSGHEPWDEEHKKLEYNFAEFGMSAIETCYAAMNTTLGKKANQERFVEALAINSRKILDLDIPEITEEAMAELTLFDPTENWKVDRDELSSKGRNNPFIGKELKGKVLGIIKGSKSRIR
jgi:dihydroorotase